MLYSIGVTTGFRISDILRITPQNVKGRYLELREQKTGKMRRKKLTAQQARWILAHAPVSAPVFCMSRQAVWKYFKKHVPKSTAVNVGTHSMRKKYALNLFDECADIVAVQKDLVHDNLSTTLLYLYGGLQTKKSKPV